MYLYINKLPKLYNQIWRNTFVSNIFNFTLEFYEIFFLVTNKKTVGKFFGRVTNFTFLPILTYPKLQITKVLSQN